MPEVPSSTSVTKIAINVLNEKSIPPRKKLRKLSAVTVLYRNILKGIRGSFAIFISIYKKIRNKETELAKRNKVSGPVSFQLEYAISTRGNGRRETHEDSNKEPRTSNLPTSLDLRGGRKYIMIRKEAIPKGMLM